MIHGDVKFPLSVPDDFISWIKVLCFLISSKLATLALSAKTQQ